MMLSTGFIEFEPTARPAKKAFPLTLNIALMTAGGSSLQARILPKLEQFVKERLEEDSSSLLPVADVADQYKKIYQELRREIAEEKFLFPYDLNFDTFVSRQNEMSADFINNVSFKLENFRFEPEEDVAAIITGLDENGPHIFEFQDDTITCDDKVGFAAVGSGSFHALSHLMLSGHSPFTAEAKALLMAHRAKKKSEVSPGVGEKTDMFVIGSNPNSFMWLEPFGDVTLDIVKDMDDMYGEYNKGIEKSDVEYENKVQTYLNKLSNSTTDDQKPQLTQGDNDNRGTGTKKSRKTN